MMQTNEKIKTKLLLPIISMVILLDIVVVLSCTLIFDDFLNKKNIQTLLDAHKTMQNQFDYQLRLAGQSALRISLENEFRSAVKTKDIDSINKIALRLAKDNKIDLCVITDETGKVLARTHRTQTGDSIADYALVSAALKGKNTTIINSSAPTRLSLNGGAPIYSSSNDGNLVGTIIVGFRLDTNSYVDNVKELTRQEAIVFLGNEVISSTLKGITGHKGYSNIIAQIPNEGKHIGQANLLGDDYRVCYSPIYDKDKVIGTLFSALSMKEQKTALQEFLLIGSIVGLVFLSFMIMFVYRVVNNIVNPIRELAEAFENVSDVSPDESLLKLEKQLSKSNIKEIAFLQNALSTMLKQLKRSYDLQLKSMEMEVEKERILATSQAKDRVFANISHEIRTPMNAIQGISEILLHDDKLDKQQKKYISDIKISTENLIEIVNDVLDLSKLEEGKMKLQPVDYNFQLFIGNICSLAKYLAKEKGLRFYHSIKGEVPACLYGDDVRLKQILLNFISNAVKFTKRGDVILQIVVEEDLIRFSVIDSGIGIPEDKFSLLFEAFEQVYANANRLINGTGLGLPICKYLVELMGGTIHVESVYGVGSTFTAVVPKIPGDESKIYYEDDDLTVAIEKDVNILIVDDNMANLNVACGLIRILFGIECAIATSGSECLQKAKQNVYDLIFMDHMMPGMDGIETTFALRRMGGYLEQIPIIALTANAVTGMKEVFLSNGMNGFLSKPINKAELRETIKYWLGREESEQFKRSSEQISIPSAWTKIPGLNVFQGVDNAAGQIDIYIRSINILKQIIPYFTINASKLSAQNDLHELVIHIHGMKSSLAGIGATEISAEFLNWEHKFLAGQHDECQNLLPQLLENLQQFAGQLSLIKIETKNVIKKSSMVNFEQAVESMRNALSSYDYDEVNRCTEYFQHFLNNLEEDTFFEEFFFFIEQFNYDDALAWLEKMDIKAFIEEI